MPAAETILKNLQAIVKEGLAFSILARALLLGLVGYFVWRKRLEAPYLAGYVGLVLLAASVMAIGFQDHAIIPTFFVLFPLGLLWGREALVMPPRPAPSAPRLVLASAFALFAFFYPHFMGGPWRAAAFAPLGILPCPTLIFASAAIIAAGRSFSLYAVIPTWVIALLYGLIGVFYLGVKEDWPLVAAVPVSLVAYVLAPAGEARPRGRKFKRRH